MDDSGARRRRLVVAVMVCVLLLLGVLTARLVNRDPNPEPVQDPGVVHAEPLSKTPTTQPPAAPLSQLTDPETFTRRVVRVLFDWDTMQLDGRRQIVETLVPVGDPTGESTAGLVSDIEGYLPTDEVWVELQQYETRQWIQIRTVSEPSTWKQVSQQAGPETIAPGTVALTVHGVRHRSGAWEEREVSSAHPVSFTVFVICGPTYDECHLLRLSMLDTPLP